MGHDMEMARGVDLDNGMGLTMLGGRFRRGEGDILCPGRFSGEPHRYPVHWLLLRITDTHAHLGRVWEAWDAGPYPEHRV